MTQKFDVGGAWEDRSWELRLNVEVAQWSDWKPCKHAIGPRKEVKTYPNGVVDEMDYWIIPRVAVAFNEGGYASTGICVDCILEHVR